MKKLFILPLLLSVSLVSSAQEIDFRRVNIEVDGGWGYRLGKVKADNEYQKDYLKGLKSGVSVGGAFHFFLRHTFGLGLKYSFFYANNKWGDVRDKTYFNYIGPSLHGKIPPGAIPNIKLCYTASLGFLHYQDNGRGYVDQNQLLDAIIKAKTLGVYTDFGAEFRLGARVYFTAKVYLLGGTISKAEVTTLYGQQTIDLDENENLSRFGLSAGLKIGL